MRAMKIAWVLVTSVIFPSTAFVAREKRFQQAYHPSLQRRHFNIPFQAIRDDSSTGSNEEEKEAQQQNQPWIQQGLMISSFSDGLQPNTKARDFLCRSLVQCLLKEQQTIAEKKVEESVVFSPCNGPDITAMNEMEQVDQALQDVLTVGNPATQIQNDKSNNVPLRFVFIPTAMYALRPESNNTPGKQRQRARADGKKRRNAIVGLLQELIPNVPIHAVTLDLDDGSIKQPEVAGGSDKNDASFPKNGKEALNEWKPHFLYIQGGNTFWLYHCMDKGDWSNDIVSLLTDPESNTVYCGASAGAIVLGTSMEIACWKELDDPRIVPGMETYESWQGVPGLGLVGNLAFFPHYDPQKWKATVDKNKQKLPPTVETCCLEEEDAYLIDGKTKQCLMVSALPPVSDSAVPESLS